jgi:hypothetical protein
MLNDSYKKLNKNQKVEIHEIKSFIGKGDNNNDGKIEKKELRQIILKSVKVQAPPVEKKNNYDD